jgi:hypothetical protein
MDPERPRAEGRIYHLDDCFSDRRSVGIGRHNGTACFEYLVAKAFIGAGFVFGDARFIRGPARNPFPPGAAGQLRGLLLHRVRSASREPAHLF